MRSARTIAALLAGLALLAAAPARAGSAPGDEAARARTTIVAWLDCEECGEGELVAVVRLGPVAVPSLAATLREGLSPANRELLRRELGARWDAIRDYARDHPAAAIKMDRETFVAQSLARIEARHRARAAEALGALGGPDAERALRDALSAGLPPAVEEVVREAWERLRAGGGSG